MEVSCHICNTTIKKKPSQVINNKTGKHYCSRDCFAIGLVKRKKLLCATCGKEITKTPAEIAQSISGNSYCSHTCSAKASNVARSKCKYAYRAKALRELPNACANCGYDKIVDILHVHHKDRNRNNNDISNLEILCPTCHHTEHYLNNDGMYTLKSNL